MHYKLNVLAQNTNYLYIHISLFYMGGRMLEVYFCYHVISETLLQLVCRVEELVDGSRSGLVEAGAANQLVNGGMGNIFQATTSIQQYHAL